MTERILLAELDLSSGVAPSEFRILSRGENPTRKGVVVFDEPAAESVMQEFELGGVDLPLDFDHAMADPTTRPQDRAAAGWFRPSIRNGELWATELSWTPKGREAVESKEFRYTSLWGDVEPVGNGDARRLRRLRNVALTNTPATLRTLPLVAHEDVHPNQGMKNMSDTDKARSPLVVTLGARDEAEAIEKVTLIQSTLSDVAGVLEVEAKPDLVKGAIRALKLQADKGKAAEAQLSELKTKIDADKKDALIAKLSDEGKLPPALHEWARTQSIESLTAFGEKAPAVVSTKPVESNQGGVTTTLSEEERQVAKLLGLSGDDVLKHKLTLVKASA